MDHSAFTSSLSPKLGVPPSDLLHALIRGTAFERRFDVQKPHIAVCDSLG